MAERIDPESGQANIRLFVGMPLSAADTIALSKDQTHYLRNVMRRQVGDAVCLFNGRDGEWIGKIVRAARNSCDIELVSQSRAQTQLPDVWLLFAPLKKARIDYLAQKATEMGAARLQPVLTKRTQVSRVNTERLLANAVEAAEQCGCLSVPHVSEPVPLHEILNDWDPGRRIMYCDEGPEAPPALAALTNAEDGPWALLIGPEGGFDAGERETLRGKPFVLPVSLGPRIMRADTAIVAALSLLQATRGDWR